MIAARPYARPTLAAFSRRHHSMQVLFHRNRVSVQLSVCGMRYSDMDRDHPVESCPPGYDTFTMRTMIRTTSVPDTYHHVDTDIGDSNQLFKPYHPNVKYG